ncbi:hypothetical protein [Thermomonas sp. HDW16]|uniref:hypothetical protein n=1 Tax=Thermomonas sp. HDW16 TaxID=2714945 RepID=UPI001407D3A6|nr:hypothetical protein [Thermomonas sp. HDW16]QIL20107.1 hypothetical protein G7079_04800 [Thermomonas sp. HDW16]
MNTNATAPTTPAPRRLLRITAVAGIVLVLLVALLAWLMQPPRATGFLLNRIGDALGLRITASGMVEYRLRGTPQLVLHDVLAQRPGDASALLRAERVLVSLPWSTIRARGDDLTVQRVELDAPVLDVPALQRWQATRPPSETRIPTLRDGLHIVRGRIDNDDWRIDGIDVELPSLSPTTPVNAKLRGRYLDPPTRIPFDLDIALTKPENDAGIAAIGGMTIEGDGWTLPAQVRLSGPLHLGDDQVRMSPAKIGMSARYVSGTSQMPFVLGAYGPLLFDEGVWSLDPASLVLRGEGSIPDASARGAIALGRRLVLRLNGIIAAWPQAWPVLPPPLSSSKSSMPFALDYAGRVDFSDIAALQVRRDQTLFDARFQLPVVLDWINADAGGSPLPPLQGRLRTPRVEIAGARLEGVEVEFDDPGTAPSPATP